jgi:hypothetical protein
MAARNSIPRCWLPAVRRTIRGKAGVLGVAPALTVNDRWIGANLVSDHVPAVLEFQCP